MDMKKLAKQILAIAEAAAPMVGLGDELAAGKKVVAAIEDLFSTNKASFNSTDQAALQTSLAALHAKVDAHAARTAASLG